MEAAPEGLGFISEGILGVLGWNLVKTLKTLSFSIEPKR